MIFYRERQCRNGLTVTIVGDFASLLEHAIRQRYGQADEISGLYTLEELIFVYNRLLTLDCGSWTMVTYT
jgi:hypothetical protein